MYHRRIAILCAAIVVGCSESPTGPKTTTPISPLPVQPQLVSFRLTPNADGAVTSMRWRLIAGAGGAPVDSGVITTGTATTVSVQVTPGQYVMQWPDSMITIAGARYLIRPAPPSQTINISQTSTNVQLSTIVEPMSGVILFRPKLPESQTPISPTSFTGRIAQGAAAPATFTTTGAAVHDLLTAGVTYRVSWPATATVVYDGITHRLATVDTAETVVAPASLKPVEVGPDYKLTHSGVFIATSGLPAEAQPASAVASWQTADGAQHSLTCPIGTTRATCEGVPASTGVRFTWPAVTVNGVTYQPSAPVDVLLPPNFQATRTLTATYAPAS
jgi:hypothetical protein